MIVFDNVTFGYSLAPPIFSQFNWRVSQGDTWAVLGPSGCGKTTLLYLLAGLRLPHSGKILIHDTPVTRPRPQTGLILQEYGLLPWANIQENALLGLRIRDFYGPDGTHAPINYQPGGEITAHVDLWLDRMGLSSVRHKYPAQISGGQRQRAAIARTLALEPDLLLTDEPFSSLDAPTRESLQELTLDLCAEWGITLILVTHAIEEAAYLGKKILLLQHPPNTEPFVLDNSEAGNPGYRESETYHLRCRELRRILEPAPG